MINGYLLCGGGSYAVAMTMAMGAEPGREGLLILPAPAQSAWPRIYLVSPPFHFAVEYAINPWMRPDQPADPLRAVRQWERLRQIYTELGHAVHLIEPVPGLPDMVFAANGATVVGGAVLGARFRHPERAAEAGAYLDWFRGHGYADVHRPQVINEGEGDILCPGDALLAGYGFRSDPGAADELAAAFGLPVHPVRLVDPRFYHLDTAMCVLDASTAAYYPAAFDDAGRELLKTLFSELRSEEQ